MVTANMLRNIGIDVTTTHLNQGDTLPALPGLVRWPVEPWFAATVNKNSVFQTYFMGLDFVSLKIPAAFTAAANASINSKAYDPKLVQAAFKALCDDVTVIPYAEQVQCYFYQKVLITPIPLHLAPCYLIGRLSGLRKAPAKILTEVRYT